LIPIPADPGYGVTFFMSLNLLHIIHGDMDVFLNLTEAVSIT